MRALKKFMFLGIIISLFCFGGQALKVSAMKQQGIADFRFEFNKQENTACFAGIKNSDTKSIKIPEVITFENKQYYVTKIKEEAFQGNKFIQNITIPSTITKISKWAFNGCENLKTVKAEKVNYIGYAAFQDCKNLEEIHLAKEELTVEDYAFNGCEQLNFICKGEKNKITLGGKTIGEGTFNKCGKLEIVQAFNVDEIQTAAFQECKELRKIYLSKEKLKVKDYAFNGCKKLNFFCGDEKNKLKLSEKEIYKNSFTHCEKLEIVEAPQATCIEVSAFKNCEGLKKIYLSDKELEVQESAFNGCMQLEFNCGETKNKVKLIGSKILKCSFFHCQKLEIVEAPQATCIEEAAFDGCVGLKKIYLSNQELAVKCFAFNGCMQLEFNCGDKINEIQLSDTEIFKQSFSDCQKLEKINAPNVKIIRAMAFSNCKNLKFLQLNKINKKSISTETGAFNFCENLESIDGVCFSNVGDAAFQSCSKFQKIYLTNNCGVGRFAFNGCLNLKFCFGNQEDSINKINLQCEVIPDFAFCKCKQIQEVDIPQAKTIGKCAFMECQNIIEINAPKLQSACDLALQGCCCLQKLNVPLALDLKMNQEIIFGNSDWEWYYPLISEQQLQQEKQQQLDKEKLEQIKLAQKNNNIQAFGNNPINENPFKGIRDSNTKKILTNLFSNKSYDKEKITCLDFSGTEIENIDDLPIFFPKLIKLKLNNTKIKDLATLQQFKFLEEVYLNNTQINDDAILMLLNIQTLQRISLSNTSITNVNRLCELKKLTHLHLSGTAIKNDFDISQFKTLTHLDLSNTIIDKLNNFQNDTIQNLNISETNIDFNLIEDSVAMLQFKKLNYLVVENMLWQQSDILKNQIVKVQNMCKQYQINFECTLIESRSLDFTEDLLNVDLEFKLDESGMFYNVENLQLKVSLLAQNQYDKMGDADKTQFKKVVFAISKNNFQTLNAHMVNVKGMSNKVLSLDFDNGEHGRGNARVYVEKINGVLYLRKINFKHM